ncbi:MAG: hypothetical protein HFE77_00370 [Clostridiales bacterium]|nr:hypothetical protein [Clostridiales bacterium]
MADGKEKWRWIEKELQGVIDELTTIAQALMAGEVGAEHAAHAAALSDAADWYKEILALFQATEKGE